MVGRHVLAALLLVPIEQETRLDPSEKLKNLVCLSRIETKFLVRLARSLVAIVTEMFGLPLYNRNTDKDATERR